jgi:hypothetical protein
LSFRAKIDLKYPAMTDDVVLSSIGNYALEPQTASRERVVSTEPALASGATAVQGTTLMAVRRKKSVAPAAALPDLDYTPLLADVCTLVEHARRAAARSVNATMTELYWHIGRLVVEREQGGAERAAYGDARIRRLAEDLTRRFGRGFSHSNLAQMRRFHLSWPKSQTLSAKPVTKPKFQTLSGKSAARPKFPLLGQMGAA